MPRPMAQMGSTILLLRGQRSNTQRIEHAMNLINSLLSLTKALRSAERYWLLARSKAEPGLLGNRRAVNLEPVKKNVCLFVCLFVSVCFALTVHVLKAMGHRDWLGREISQPLSHVIIGNLDKINWLPLN